MKANPQFIGLTLDEFRARYTSKVDLRSNAYSISSPLVGYERSREFDNNVGEMLIVDYT